MQQFLSYFSRIIFSLAYIGRCLSIPSRVGWVAAARFVVSVCCRPAWYKARCEDARQQRMAGPLQWCRAVLLPLLEAGLQPAVAAAGLLGNIASWVVLRRPTARHHLHPGYYSLLASQATHRLHIYGQSYRTHRTRYTAVSA